MAHRLEPYWLTNGWSGASLRSRVLGQHCCAYPHCSDSHAVARIITIVILHLDLFCPWASLGLVRKVGSDKTRYVPHNVHTSAQDGHYARLPQYAADVMRCTDFVRGRGVYGHVERCGKVLTVDASIMTPWFWSVHLCCHIPPTPHALHQAIA
jgi:hypothetical protein